MKFIRKMFLIILILPVIFLTVACSYDSKGNNDAVTPPGITQPDDSSNVSDNNQNGNDSEEGSEDNNNSDNDSNDKPSDSGSSENNPDNPDGEGDKDNSGEEANPSDEETDPSDEENNPSDEETDPATESYKISFEIENCGIPVIVEKFDNPSNVVSLFPEAIFSSNIGEVYYIENILDKYAIHFLNQKDGEICTTEIDGKQYLEFELYYSNWSDFEIIINDYAQTIERNDGGISNISFKFEIKQNSSFTLNLFVI